MKEDIEILNKVYSDTYLASHSLNALLPSIENSVMRRAIISQINEYDKISSDAKREISSLGEKTKKNTVKTAFYSMENKLLGKINPSPSHISERIIKESNKEIIEITKEMNKSIFSSPTSHDIARRLVRAEEENIERLKGFL